MMSLEWFSGYTFKSIISCMTPFYCHMSSLIWIDGLQSPKKCIFFNIDNDKHHRKSFFFIRYLYLFILINTFHITSQYIAFHSFYIEFYACVQTNSNKIYSLMHHLVNSTDKICINEKVNKTNNNNNNNHNWIMNIYSYKASKMLLLGRETG